MEILTHVNKRLKSRPLVQLPVEPLLVQYQTTDSSFLHNFSIIYITMGFPRLSIDKQTELAPVLLNCLEGKPESHQDKYVLCRASTDHFSNRLHYPNPFQASSVGSATPGVHQNPRRSGETLSTSWSGRQAIDEEAIHRLTPGCAVVAVRSDC